MNTRKQSLCPAKKLPSKLQVIDYNTTFQILKDRDKISTLFLNILKCEFLNICDVKCYFVPFFMLEGEDEPYTK